MLLSFFDLNISNFIQLISLPLELIGFTLTCIEMFYPNTADSIENKIDALGLNSMNRYNSFIEKTKKVSPLIFRIFFGVIACCTPIIAISFSGFHLLEDLSAFFWIIYVIIFIKIIIFCLPYIMDFLVQIMIGLIALIETIYYIFGILLFYPTSKIISWLNKITKGKALGSIGVILGVIGVLIEFYPFVNKG